MTVRPTLAGLLLSCGLLAGCHHRRQPVQALALPPVWQVPVDPAPQSDTPPKVAPQTVESAPEAAVVVPPKVKKPRRKPAPTPPASAPVQVASSGSAPASASEVIGTLSTDAANSQDTRARIAASLAQQEKRLRELPASVQSRRSDVERVRYFCSQATLALSSGDLDGAATLTVKARVLLDDLLK